MRRVDGSRCSLTIDGWTGINGNSVVNYIVLVGKDTFFLESNCTGSTSHDADLLVTHIERVITKYNLATLSSVVTNNTAANKAMWRSSKRTFRGCTFMDAPRTWRTFWLKTPLSRSSSCTLLTRIVVSSCASSRNPTSSATLSVKYSARVAFAL